MPILDWFLSKLPKKSNSVVNPKRPSDRIYRNNDYNRPAGCRTNGGLRGGAAGRRHRKW